MSPNIKPIGGIRKLAKGSAGEQLQSFDPSAVASLRKAASGKKNPFFAVLNLKRTLSGTGSCHERVTVGTIG